MKLSVLGATLVLVSCTPAETPPPPACAATERLQLMFEGAPACGAVRVRDDTLLTARHCGPPLDLDGAPLTRERVIGDDLQLMRGAVAGPAHPLARYPGERQHVCAWLARGPVYVEAWPSRGPIGSKRWIGFVGKCAAGDSGSPVLTSRGVVGAVVQRMHVTGICYAELLP